MRATLSKTLAAALVPMLLVVLAAPAAALENGFGLNLEQAFARGNYLATDEAEAEEMTEAAGEAVETETEEDDSPSALDDRFDPRGSALDRMSREENLYQATPNSELPRKRGGVGRWLKKRWWVPVLAAVAIGVAINDSGDDDRGGEDD